MLTRGTLTPQKPCQWPAAHITPADMCLQRVSPGLQLDSCVEAPLLVCCFVSMTQAASAAAYPPAPTASLLRRLGVRIRYSDLSASTYGCSNSGNLLFGHDQLAYH